MLIDWVLRPHSLTATLQKPAMSRLRCSGAPSLVSPISYSYCMTQTKHEVNQSLHRLRASDGGVCVCAHHKSLSYPSIYPSPMRSTHTTDSTRLFIYLYAHRRSPYYSPCMHRCVSRPRPLISAATACIIGAATLCVSPAVCARDTARAKTGAYAVRDSLETRSLTQILTH